MNQVCILIFIHFCDEVLSVALVLFLGWGLFTERVVAQPLHYIFVPRYKGVEVYQPICYLVLIYMKL